MHRGEKFDSGRVKNYVEKASKPNDSTEAIHTYDHQGVMYAHA